MGYKPSGILMLGVLRVTQEANLIAIKALAVLRVKMEMKRMYRRLLHTQ